MGEANDVSGRQQTEDVVQSLFYFSSELYRYFIQVKIPLGNVFSWKQISLLYNFMTSYHSKKRKGQQVKRHHWTLKENGFYLDYLQAHQTLFKDFKTKKQAKVFVNLSKGIRTRNTSQVKSHHQKMMIKFGSIPNIIISLIEQQEVYSKDHPVYIASDKFSDEDVSIQKRASQTPKIVEPGEIYQNDQQKVNLQHTRGVLYPIFSSLNQNDDIYLRICIQTPEENDADVTDRFFDEMID